MANTICINDIIDAISIRLNELFNEEFTIYTNNVKQGFETPCFYIRLFQETRTQKVGIRYYNTASLVIHVFLEEPKIEELNEIGHKLYELENLELENGDILTGTSMKTEFVDDVLEFFINYNFFTFKEEKNKSEIMEDLEVTGEVRLNG